MEETLETTGRIDPNEVIDYRKYSPRIGGPIATYISIITTHQARLRCLLSKIFNKPMKRFKNG